MDEERTASASLMARITASPYLPPDGPAPVALAEIEAAWKSASGPAADLLADDRVHRLIAGTLAGSPYLSGLMARDPKRVASLLLAVPEQRLDALVTAVSGDVAQAGSVAAAMAVLRRFKSEAALLIALADIGGVWAVTDVVDALSRTADAAVRASVAFLFRQAAMRGDWLGGHADDPCRDSGYIVLGMGKYGARELNYSSDIDLIVFYERARARLRDGLEPQTFFVRLTRELVRMLQERTEDGYVFRTDLRLRPDPGATQMALSTDAALVYYESFGQNWERAAMIKARPVAGDVIQGQEFLAELAPFIWRKYLDFAAIADIHAMKRQIHAYRGFGDIGVAGHNIKLGRGGIREIEFFVQTQQLIAGGRQAGLRVSQTLVALAHLAARGWIKPQVRDDLTEAYGFLRGIEHRLQMVADDQTHELPSDEATLERFAWFAGYPSQVEFARALTIRLKTVRRHYARLFEDMPELTRGGVNMVFAGEADDPGTLEALSKIGFSHPVQVLAMVRGWHHGRYAAVRSAQARERLTEVQPILIEALGQTADPDAALVGFDRFLSSLPTGVQLFSLLRANPNLLRLVADIMGSAPRLARILSRRQRVLDAVLDPRIIGTLPNADDLRALITAEFADAQDFQEVLDRARVVGSEQAFLIGVRVLTGMVGAPQAGGGYALLAEQLIESLQHEVEKDFARVHGRVPGGAMAVVAMGKLGGREMTAASDLDLIVIYDFEPGATQSDGARPLPASQYFARLVQRLISALSSPTAEGQLYDVDLRLRPSGHKGPVATQLTSFIEYQSKEAWTWEHMALTRARVLTGPPELRAKVERAVRDVLVRPRDPAKIVHDVREMRGRIWAEKGTDNPWELKHARGGLVDIEFIAQHLQLVHGPARDDVLDQNTVGALTKLDRHGLLGPDGGPPLVSAARLLNDLTQVLRLCLEGPVSIETIPDGLKELLARVGGAPSFASLDTQLKAVLAESADQFDRLVC